MKMEQLVPAARAADVQSVLDSLIDESAPALAPFSDDAIDFCDAVARTIFRHPAARAHPALLSLAYWMRKASVRRLAAEFAELETAETTLAPRGLVFHIPPTNVDTMFVYSFVVSLLVGNKNVIRLSRQRSDQMHFLCDILNSTIADPAFSAVRETTRIVSYGHEQEISGPLSLAADVRVIWGGDATIEAIRSLPAKATAKDLAFADRYSLAAIEASAYLASNDEGRDALAHSLFNDAYWFDQMACSSPRLIVWIGEEPAADLAASDFWARLQMEVSGQHYELPIGAVTAKLGFVYGSIIDRSVARYQRYSNELTVLRLESLSRYDRSHPGAGTFFEAVVRSLVELAPFVTQKDQTLGVFGQEPEAVRALVRAVNGRGIDRIVPIGAALNFGRFWDGYDLLQELTRTIVAPLHLPSPGARG